MKGGLGAATTYNKDVRLIAGGDFYTSVQRDDAWRVRLQYRFLLIVIDFHTLDPVVARSEELTEPFVPCFLQANGNRETVNYASRIHLLYPNYTLGIKCNHLILVSSLNKHYEQYCFN